MIHEGAKCADIAQEKMPEWVHLSWSGGSGKADLAKWSMLKDFEDIYILPDDDQKKYPENKLVNAGEIMPPEEQPGLKAALKIKDKLSQAIIINPVIEARRIKPSGADIEEILQVFTPEKFIEYALNKKNHFKNSDLGPGSLPPAIPRKETPAHAPDPGSSSEPFKILGIGDDGRAYFLTEAERLYDSTLDSLSKGKLRVLTGDTYWMMNYPLKRGADWESAINDIIRISQYKDFDKTLVRGRGAWIDDDDKISYHDGYKTSGEWDKRKTYVRLRRRDIGINDEMASIDLCHKLRDIIFKLSFETKTDAVRCIGWAALAPFAGALKYRPAILLTGPSGSGKSTVQEYVLQNLTEFIWADAKETSVAGMRSRIGIDSAVAFFEEAEQDNDKSKLKVDDIMSFIRSNYTSKSPDAFKGTKEGGWVSYRMNSMFGIAAINPTIENVADENRIFRINLIKSNGNGWKKIEKQLKSLLTEKNCRSIRALTWNKLKTIFELSDRVVELIQDKTHKDYRSSFSDALLASAFIIIWDRIDNPADEAISNMLDKYYSFAPPEEKRDEASEFVQELFDIIVEVQHENSNLKEKITIYECLINCYEIEENRAYKMHLSRCGIKLTNSNNIAIYNNSAFIKKIMRINTGYSKILKRHPDFVRADSVEYFPHDKTPRKCTILKSLIQEHKEKEIDSRLFEII
jgi:hypothetical protein